MKRLKPAGLIAVSLLAAGIFGLTGCDSGEKVVDKATGSQDVKQYQKMKKDIGKIADEQAKKHSDVLDETKGK